MSAAEDLLRFYDELLARYPGSKHSKTTTSG
jgi:hypothetical protein